MTEEKRAEIEHAKPFMKTGSGKKLWGGMIIGTVHELPCIVSPLSGLDVNESLTARRAPHHFWAQIETQHRDSSWLVPFIFSWFNELTSL